MKRKKITNPLKIAAVYIGTVVGAGFATGQEILQFFAVFGARGLPGILLATLLFMFFGAAIMKIGYTVGARSHLDVLSHLGGKIFVKSLDIIILVFLLGALSAMVAGTGALISNYFGLPAIFGGVLMAVLTAITVLSGKNGVLSAISAVVPFLLLSVIGVSLYAIIAAPTGAVPPLPTTGGLTRNWLLSAVTYTSYNILLSVSVLAPLGAEIDNKKTLLLGGALGGAGLGLACALIYFALLSRGGTILTEIPLAEILREVGRPVRIGFSVVLIAEVYTTAVSSLYGLSARLINAEKSPAKAKTIIISTAAVATVTSLLGFSNLVRYFYSFVGVAGLILLLAILKKSIPIP